MTRIILHVDMDSFYASVEELRNPEIKGKAIVTCMFSGRTKDSGAVSAANYKARELGIHSGMPIMVAKSLAKGKDVVFLPSDREYYSSVSDRIMDILRSEADSFEQVSVDEAYLDVSKRSRGSWEKALKLAESLKNEIRRKEHLTCSVGIGPNKLVAKMASKAKKPDGLTLVKDSEVKRFFEKLPVSKLFGIGPKTVEELESLGIKTAKELAEHDMEILEERFGTKRGRMLQETAQGRDDSPVEEREAQQISRMATLKKDSNSSKEIFGKIQELAKDVDENLREEGVAYKTVSIITIDTHLQMQTRSHTTIESSSLSKNLDIAKELLEKFLQENPGKMLRRIGIRVSNLSRLGEKKAKKQKTLGDFPKA
ncbi:MAG: DNA polymerase IV [Candidatus Aenigmarchaeota archaeon]|nr:DNA polymerase IV [Candidatus Aenigmarchaeota archaeon]